MKSFLKEIESKFKELEESNGNSTTHGFVDDNSISDNGEEEIDEQNVTGAIAGYNTPGAFTTDKKFKKKKFTWAGGQVNESKHPISKKYVPGHYQTVEFDEEVQNDKFPFSIDESDWWNKDMEYPSRDLTKSPGTSHKKDREQKIKNIDEILEDKYMQLIEGYRDFKTGDVKPSRKVKSTIQEIAKKLQEIETLVNYNSKLKNESGVTSDSYGPATQKALNKISERLLKISERVRSLGE